MDAEDLRVGVDVTPLIAGAAGVARYSRELVAAVQARGVETHCFAIGRGAEPVTDDVRVLRVPLRIVHETWRRFGRPRVDRLIGDVDLVHSLDMVPPPSRLPVVTTVYDLGAIKRPELYPPRSERIAARQLDAARRADVVITDSQAVRGELAESGFDESRVVVVHGAPVPLPPAGATPLEAEPYLLVVGALAASKGSRILVSAFAKARLAGVRLVFAGATGFGGEGLPEVAASMGLADQVTFLGRVDDATLAALYEGALALCCASLVEGFGLPALEAMHAGVPVVATTLDALREVAGDAARWVAPDDDASLADGLRDIVENEMLRTRLIELGRKRAAQFTWDRAAEATIAAYRLALANR